MRPEKRENEDLLEENLRNVSAVVNVNSDEGMKSLNPPDGGLKAYSVAVASFLTNGLIFSVINSYSVVYTVLLEKLKDDENAEIKCSLVGSLTIGTTFALSPVSGILTSFLGLRLTAIIGGCIAVTGLLLSSFVVDSVEALWFTYGIMYGVGASLCYTPSLAVLGLYFHKYLGVVNGVVTIGSSIFTVLMVPLMSWLLQNHGLEFMFRILCIFALGLIACGLLFTPVAVLPVVDEPKEKCFKGLIKRMQIGEMCKIRKYKFWAISMPVALFGYFVPYVHIKKFIIEANFETGSVNLPLQCIAITSALGRLTFGMLGDRKGIDKIMLQQVSFYTIGVLTIILPFVQVFWLIVAIALGMGIFEGGFIALIGPIAFDLVGPKHAAQAIGCMLGLAALPLSIGPSIAGALHRIHNNYTLPFVLAGISPLIGATMMFLIRAGDSKKPRNMNGHIGVDLERKDIEKDPVSPLMNGHGNVGRNN